MGGATKIVAAFVAVSAIMFKPVIFPLLHKMGKAPVDSRIGEIPVLSQEELIPFYENKSALVVGGTRGVGFGTALALCRAGTQVTIVGRSAKSGQKALDKLQQNAKIGKEQSIQFLQGDLGTVESTMTLVDALKKSNQRYDYLVVSAATFPDWSSPLLNDDGLDKSFFIAVVGRFLLYRNMHRFLQPNARVLNVLAAGMEVPIPFDRELAEGSKTVSNLPQALSQFTHGNDLMLIGMDERDPNIQQFTRVSTHPGVLHTDLHLGQSWWFDVAMTILVALMGVSEEECGVRQASILCSDLLGNGSLSFVDEYMIGRKCSKSLQSQVENHLDWLWSMLLKLEESHIVSEVQPSLQEVVEPQETTEDTPVTPGAELILEGGDVEQQKDQGEAPNESFDEETTLQEPSDFSDESKTPSDE
jgi:hypothetical protein